MADDKTAPTQEPKQSLSLLASEMFGADFHGEVEKPAAASEGAAGGGDGEQGQGEEAPPKEGAEADTEGEGGEPGEGDGQESEGEGGTFSSLQELIDAAELDAERAGALKIAVKIDGKAGEATLKDLIDGYQMRQAAEHRLEEAKAKTKAVHEDLAAKTQAAQAQVVAAAELVKSIEARLNDETSSINWKQLRDSDPAEYAAKKAEIAERRAEVDEMKRKAVETWQKSQETQAAETLETLKQRFAAEQAALLEAPVFSEWRDPEKAKAGQVRLVEYLPTQGFSRDEIMGASDHRLLVLAEKARRYDENLSKTDVARKKMATVPKVMKPGAPKPAQQQAREKTDRLKSKLRESGSLDDAAALLRARRTGG